jgi:hypothetical protein
MLRMFGKKSLKSQSGAVRSDEISGSSGAYQRAREKAAPSHEGRVKNASTAPGSERSVRGSFWRSWSS